MTMQAEPWFGINTAQVRIFLDELAELDLDRAIEVWNSYAAARDRGYDEALEAADAVAAKQRTDAWFRARQAAATLARERLGEPAAMGEIVDALAAVAGSLVIRDLLSRHDFRLLQLPWTRREGDVGLAADDDVADPVAAVAGVAVASQGTARRAAAGAAGAMAAAGRAGLRSGRVLPAPVRIAIVATTVVVLAVLTRPAGENTDTSFGGPPGGSVPSGIVFPDPSDGESSLPTGSSLPAASATHAPTPSPSRAPGHGAPPPPATLPPTPGSTPTPTLPPSPTPNPTPTAPTICTVISLLDVTTVKAQQQWANAGFTGSVTFSPDVPPQYKIVWQSLAIGAKVTCTHGITVSDHAP